MTQSLSQPFTVKRGPSPKPRPRPSRIHASRYVVGNPLSERILVALPATMEMLKDEFPTATYGAIRNSLAKLRAEGKICRGGFGYSAPYVTTEPLSEDL